VLLGSLAGLLMAVLPCLAQTIQLKAWTIGPDDPSVYRATNLQTAAERLNAELAQSGASARVSIATDFWTGQAQPYVQRLLLAFQSGDIPDIVLNGHEFVGRYASAGYIRALDDLLLAHQEALADIYPVLWQAVSFQGQRWGIPQDTEARMMYVRTDHLRQLGWHTQEIEALARRVEQGEFTLTDLVELAQSVKKAGIAPWGLYHHPAGGVDVFQIYLAFGGQLLNAQGELVLQRSALTALLQYHYDLVHRWNITPATMANIPWGTILKSFVDGVVTFWQGGTWHKAEWLANYGLSEATFASHIGFFPIPSAQRGGRPQSISHPMVYMLSSACKHPALAIRLLVHASAADLNARHALQSGHLAIRTSETALPAYSADRFLSRATSLLRYASFAPNHPAWPQYEAVVTEAIRAVQARRLPVQEAVQFVSTRLRQQLRNQIHLIE
ncbi:MAG: extracellular solute-binding protein, partial [Candidatus Tectimicrobiota bacterium]